MDAILKNAAQEENYDHIEVDDDDLDDPELMVCVLRSVSDGRDVAAFMSTSPGSIDIMLITTCKKTRPHGFELHYYM